MQVIPVCFTFFIKEAKIALRFSCTDLRNDKAQFKHFIEMMIAKIPTERIQLGELQSKLKEMAEVYDYVALDAILPMEDDQVIDERPDWLN